MQFFYDDAFGPSLFLPEASSSREQDREQIQRQQSPPASNQQALAFSNIRNILNVDSDPFAGYLLRDAITGESTPSTTLVDLTEGVVDLTSSPDMAPCKKRKRGGDSPALSKKVPRKEPEHKEVEVQDLVALEEEAEYEAMMDKQKAEDLKKQQKEEATRPARLADFQCIICMDNPTNLTVTHCGHMFCSECLHEALHAGNNEKKSCPVCRTTVNTTLVGRGSDKRQPKNGVFHLEMKLMTSKALGKRPQRAS